MLKVIDATPKQPEYCTPERLAKLKSAGIETDGHIDSLKEIIMQNEFNLPGQEGEHFGFIFMQKYTRLYLNEADAMAEEILLLKEYKLI